MKTRIYAALAVKGLIFCVLVGLGPSQLMTDRFFLVDGMAKSFYFLFQDVLASLSNSIVSVEVSGSQCLCDTVLCNGAPVVGASVMGALLLALMSLVASY